MDNITAVTLATTMLKSSRIQGQLALKLIESASLKSSTEAIIRVCEVKNHLGMLNIRLIFESDLWCPTLLVYLMSRLQKGLFGVGVYIRRGFT